MARSGVRVLVAGTRRLYAEAICHTLASEFDVEAVADIGTLDNALPGSDLLIAGWDLAADGGFDLLRRARDVQPGIKLLVIGERRTRTILQKYWDAGVNGFLTSDAGLRDLFQAVMDVLAGKRYCAPAALPVRAPASGGILTRRQAEVLRLVSEGLSAKEIAHRLHVSQRTVEFHKANIMRLLGLRSSPEMIRFAMEWRPERLRYFEGKG